MFGMDFGIMYVIKRFALANVKEKKPLLYLEAFSFNFFFLVLFALSVF